MLTNRQNFTSVACILPETVLYRSSHALSNFYVTGVSTLNVSAILKALVNCIFEYAAIRYVLNALAYYY